MIYFRGKPKIKFLKDSIFGIVCSILGIYLIYQECHLFFLEKPTYSLIGKTSMTKKLFPLVKICAEPGFDVKIIKKAGYETLYAFFAGFKTEQEERFIGWNGFDENHLSDVLEDIVTLKKESALVEYATFITYVGQDHELEIKSERIGYPNGRCFSLTVPNEMEKALSLEIVLNSSFIQKSNIKNVQVFLHDPGKDVTFMSSPFVLTGERFLPGYDTIHNVDISLVKQLGDDPDSYCKDYVNDEFGDYSMCYEHEIVSMFKQLLNCTPPWFSDRKEEICSKYFELSDEKQESIGMIFYDLFAGTFSPPCLAPCSTIRYVPKYVRSEPVVNNSRIYINFPQTVEIVQQKITVDALSFITR